MCAAQNGGLALNSAIKYCMCSYSPSQWSTLNVHAWKLETQVLWSNYTDKKVKIKIKGETVQPLQ